MKDVSTKKLACSAFKLTVTKYGSHVTDTEVPGPIRRSRSNIAFGTNVKTVDLSGDILPNRSQVAAKNAHRYIQKRIGPSDPRRNPVESDTKVTPVGPTCHQKGQSSGRTKSNDGSLRE